ncbi:hypothetical protein GCM10010381_09070 [Streptomyces xantholiticus]|nr:hypothetical protein GCM10010381_09070 [Streptomyces xantholiticus]
MIESTPALLAGSMRRSTVMEEAPARLVAEREDLDVKPIRGPGSRWRRSAV